MRVLCSGSGARCVALLLAFVGCVACVKAPPASAPAPLAPVPDSWNSENGHACYVPPAFDSDDTGIRRRVLRSTALNQALTRWRGEKDPAFALPRQRVDTLENLLLTQPELIEPVVLEDYTRCVQWRAGALSIEDYLAWFEGVASDLHEQSCSHQSFELITQYVDVSRPWEVESPLCQGEAVLLRASRGEYAVHPAPADASLARWINAEGDRSSPATDPGLPCHQSGCFEGQLIARFVDRQGNTTYFPINLEAIFEAPTHGTLSFGINDLKAEDNVFRVREQVRDFLRVEMRPFQPPRKGSATP